jgi:hypothetical protein
MQEMDEVDTDRRRISINVRVDPSKHALLEQMRKTGFGLAQTERNRSDVYNEILGYGIQTYMLKTELGDRTFEKLWKILHKLNLEKINLDKIGKMLGD